MPVIITPGAPPEPIVDATSSDGRLYALVDQVGGGVYLEADFSDLDPTPLKVRFLRGADRLPVRSGHDAWAPGGKARAYDLEAALGAPAAWYAVPIYRDGSAGAETAGVQVVTRTVTRVRDIWLKSIADPLRSMQLRSLGHNVETGLDGRDAALEIPGSRYKGGSWDVPMRRSIEISVVTETLTEFRELRELISSGPMLLQLLPLFGLDDEYVKLGGMTWTFHIGPLDPRRRVTLTLNPCLRPPTFGAPLYIPGRTWDLLRDAHASWDVVEATYDDWDQIARPADAE